MSSYIYAVALGIAYAMVMRVSRQRTSRKKTKKRFPEQMQRWQTLDRPTRKILTKAMRTGLTVPAEHAAIVIEMIDMSIVTENEVMPTFRRRVLRTYAFYVTLLLMSLLPLVASEGALRFIGVVLVSTWTTMLVGLTVALVQVRQRCRTWPANRLRARQLAQQQLSPVDG